MSNEKKLSEKEEINARIDDRVNELLEMAQSSKSSIRADMIMGQREIYELLKVINNRTRSDWEVVGAVTGIFGTIVAVLFFAGFILYYLYRLVKPFVNWLLYVWSNTEPGTQLVVFVTLLIALGSAIWGIYKLYLDRKK